MDVPFLMNFNSLVNCVKRLSISPVRLRNGAHSQGSPVCRGLHCKLQLNNSVNLMFYYKSPCCGTLMTYLTRVSIRTLWAWISCVSLLTWQRDKSYNLYQYHKTAVSIEIWDLTLPLYPGGPIFPYRPMKPFCPLSPGAPGRQQIIFIPLHDIIHKFTRWNDKKIISIM